jgi:PIF1-like helicase
LLFIYQVLPVVRHGTRTQLVEASLKQSRLWRLFQIFHLHVNIRAAEDAGFADFLLDVGNGILPEDEDGKIEIPEEILSDGDLIQEVFGELLDHDNPETYQDRAILTPTNVVALSLAETVLNLLATPERIYKSQDDAQTFGGDDTTMYPTEYLHSITPSGMPPHSLRLKPGALVVILRNLNTKHGLVNGTRLIVEEMSNHVILCSFAQGPRKGDRVFIPRIELAPEDTGYPFILRRRQFPVRLAFAMTINKSQGQTLRMVGVHLPTSVFSHGQLYVALSRVRRCEDVKVLVFNEYGGRTAMTKNVVFKEVL